MSEAGINGNAAGPTIPASAETLLRFQVGKPAGEPEREGEPVYLLAAPTDKLILAYRAGCVSRGIRNPDDDEMAEVMAVTLERTKALQGLDDKTYEWHRSLIERYLALPPLEDGAPKSYDRVVIVRGMQALQDALAGTDDAPGDPAIMKLRAQRAGYGTASMRVACAVALRGWEHHEGQVEVLGLEATAATLAQVPEEAQQAIGLYWLLQRHLTDAQKKTSDSPLPSPTIPTTTPDNGVVPPSSTVAVKGSRRSRATRRGTNATISTPVT